MLALGGFALALVPILWVTFPPVLDFPNHLARIWLLAGGASRPPLSLAYAPAWSQASTNVGVDWVAVQMAHALPFDAVIRILLAALTLGPCIGGAILNRAVFGRFDAWSLAFIAFAWSTTALAGFMSFQISLAAALLAAAAMHRRLRTIDAKGLLLHFLLAGLILLIHPFGMLFYLALATGLLIGPDDARRWSRVDLRRKAGTGLLLGIVGMVPVLLFFLLAPRLPKMNGATGSGIFWDLPSHIHPGPVFRTVFSPVLGYDVWVDMALALPLFALVAWLAIGRRLQVHQGLLLVAALLFVLSFFMPQAIGDAYWLSRRLPPMAALAAVAAIRPRPGAGRPQIVVNTVLIAVTLAHVAWIGSVWHRRDADTRQLFDATRTLPPGAKVLTVLQTIDDRSAEPVGRTIAGAPGALLDVQHHFGALLVIRNRAFLPTVFAVPGQQPLRILPAFDHLTIDNFKRLYSASLVQSDPADPKALHWQDFDYVLLLNGDAADRAIMLPTGLQQMNPTGFATIYRVRKAST